MTGIKPDEIERLMLSKEQIVEVLNAIMDIWRREPLKNAKLILAMLALRSAIQITPEPLLQVIWHKVMTAFNELYALNEMMRLKGEMPNAAFFVERLAEKIRRGDLGS